MSVSSWCCSSLHSSSPKCCLLFHTWKVSVTLYIHPLKRTVFLGAAPPLCARKQRWVWAFSPTSPTSPAPGPGGLQAWVQPRSAAHGEHPGSDQRACGTGPGGLPCPPAAEPQWFLPKGTTTVFCCLAGVSVLLSRAFVRQQFNASPVCSSIGL